MKHLPSQILVATLVLAPAVLAQGLDHGSWIRARFADLQRTSPRAALAVAQRAGRVATARDVAAFKGAFRQARSKDRRAVPEWRRLDPVRHAVQAGSLPGVDVVVVEHECNDSRLWSDDLGGQTTASGDNGPAYDLDSWTYVSTGTGLVTFAVQPVGTQPIIDSTITIRDAAGDPVAFFDDLGNESLSLFLPAGTFHVEVGSWIDPVVGPGNGGGYDLVVSTDPLNTGMPRPLTASGASGVTQVPGAGPHDVFTITVPEGTVNVVLGGGDTVLLLQRSNGAVVFANDDSAAGGLGSALDVDLPAGTYYLYPTDFAGAGALAYTASFAHTPRTLPALCSNPSVSGSIAGDESLRLFRLDIPTNWDVDVATNPGPLPVGDTVLTLFDRRFNYLCDVDDDNPATHGFYSRVTAPLFAGSYLVGVTPYPGSSGGFTVTTTCGAPFAPAGNAAFGSNSLSYPGFGRINAYLLDNCTETSVRYRSDTFHYNVIGPDGVLAGTLAGTDWYAQAAELPAGCSMVIAFDRYDFSGPITVEVLPVLGCENGSLVSHAKEGDVVFVFANFWVAPAVNFGVGDRGGFCLPFPSATHISLGPQLVPPTGQVTWLVCPPVTFGVFLQQADLHTGINWAPGFFGTWRNVVDL